MRAGNVLGFFAPHRAEPSFPSSLPVSQFVKPVARECRHCSLKSRLRSYRHSRTTRILSGSRSLARYFFSL